MDGLSDDAYQHLKALALRVHGQTAGATLSATELLHEAWVKLELSPRPYDSRQHYVAVAARAMRQILVDRARRRGASKRGGGQVRTTLAGLSEAPKVLDLLTLDAVLDQLAAVSERAHAVVELRVFGGLTNQEVADVLGVSEPTVRLEWRFARVFLDEKLDVGA